MNMIKRIMNRIRNMSNSYFGLLSAFISDFYGYRLSHSKKFALANDERIILLLTHALEKGMSFSDKRTSWGGGKSSFSL